MRWILIIAISLGLHTLVFLTLTPETKDRETSIPQEAAPIKLTIVQRTVIEVVPAPPPDSDKVNQTTTKENVENPRRNKEEPSESTRSLVYSDFFPSSTEFLDSMKSDSGRGVEYGRPSPKQRAIGDQLGGVLDIPLVLRNSIDNGKAFARITREGGGYLTIDYLNGDRDIRAVLFEAIKDVENRMIFNKIFEVMGKNSVVIGLRFKVEQGLSASREEHIDVSTRDDRLMITRVRWNKDPIGSVPGRGDPHIPVMKGIPLPDEHAEKVIRRDKGHLQKLRRSPAYRAPLKNRRLPWKAETPLVSGKTGITSVFAP